MNPAPQPCTQYTSSLLRGASSALPPLLFRQRTRQFRTEEQHGPEARPDTGCVAVISGPELAPLVTCPLTGLGHRKKRTGQQWAGASPRPWHSPSPLHPTHAPSSAASPGPGPAPGPPPSSGIPQPQPGASVLSLPPTHHLNLPAANAAANPCCCKGITMQPGCILAHVCECAHTHVCTEEGLSRQGALLMPHSLPRRVYAVPCQPLVPCPGCQPPLDLE